MALERLIHELMLLHPRLALEGGGNHRGRIMVAVAGEVADGHHCVGKARLDQSLDFTGIHRHEGPPDAPAVPPGPFVPKTLCTQDLRKTIWQKAMSTLHTPVSPKGKRHGCGTEHPGEVMKLSNILNISLLAGLT